MDPASAEYSELIEEGQNIHLFKYFYLAGLTILYYDYLLTFNDERDYFWKRKKGFVPYLFMLNRYYTMLAYIVTTFMFFLPKISTPVCKKLGDFLPFGTGIPTLLMSGLLVAARVVAIYDNNLKLGAFLIMYLTAQSGVTLWAFLFPGAGPLPLPDIDLDAYEACIQLTSPRLGNSSAAWIVMDCGFDVIIISLTIFRSYQIYTLVGKLGYVFRRGDNSRPTLVGILVQDGLLYFMVLISLNVTWVVMVIAATPGLKWICAMPAQAIIVTMVSRITLNLRAHVYGRDDLLTTLRTTPHLAFTKPPDTLRTTTGGEWGEIEHINTEIELEEVDRPRRMREGWDLVPKRAETSAAGRNSISKSKPVSATDSERRESEWTLRGSGADQ